jgi:hypothetical protein
MKFPKKDLKDLAYDDASEEYTNIENGIIDNGRWTIYHRQVFFHHPTGKHYVTTYGVGATESQDEHPYEYEDDMVECNEVRPMEKLITVYE